MATALGWLAYQHLPKNWPFSTSLAGTVTNKNQDQKETKN